jgi:hypothetical protein
MTAGDSRRTSASVGSARVRSALHSTRRRTARALQPGEEALAEDDPEKHVERRFSEGVEREPFSEGVEREAA